MCRFSLTSSLRVSVAESLRCCWPAILSALVVAHRAGGDFAADHARASEIEDRARGDCGLAGDHDVEWRAQHELRGLQFFADD
ncbi:MAG: hypothetical protein LAO05_17670, partial [Acidobacteriia bacterium]|nr:hypothetical protein [Terriglobia bacterium]